MPLREDLLQPIPGSNPAGANLRYDPIYDKIKEARREEEDVDQGDWKRTRKVADWPQVIKLAGDALATKSKDLQIAAWLTEAMLKQEALGGLLPRRRRPDGAAEQGRPRRAQVQGVARRRLRSRRQRR